MPAKEKTTEGSKSSGKNKAKVEVSKKTTKSDKSKDVEEKPKKMNTKKSSNDSSSKGSKETKNSKEKDTTKSSKKTKETTEETAEKDKRNGTTILAGCEFNVNTVREWMKDYLKRYNVLVINKETKERTEKPVKIYKPAYAALTGVDEVLTSTLVNLAGQRAKKATDGLLKISEENMKDVVELDKGLHSMFGHFMKDYDDSQKYQKDVQISKGDLTRYVETKCLHGNSGVTLEPGAQNFLMFVIRKSRTLLVECAFQMSQCYAKTSLNERCILFAIKIMFPPGELQKSALKKAENAAERVKANDSSKGKDKSDKSEDGKKSASKSESKKSSKTNKKNKEDDEDEEDKESDADASDVDVEEDDEEDEDEASSSESESEEEDDEDDE